MVSQDITLSNIKQAQARLTGHIRRTPVFNTEPTNFPFKLYLKLEQHQITGSFKVRGALNKILQIGDDILQRGIVAASGGNHGRAVAYIGQKYQVPTRIYVPANAPEQKVLQIKSFDAEVIQFGSDLDEASTTAMNYANNNNLQFFHPFDDLDVVSGQGTIGLEILEDLEGVEEVIVAIGGGGLISGIACALKNLDPKIKIIGVEPEGCPSMLNSIQAGKIVTVSQITTTVGTLAIKRTCERNFIAVQKYVDEIISVSDNEMLRAAQWLWNEYGIAAELSGAASVAAITTGKYSPTKGHKVCAIICGVGTSW